MTQHFAKGTGEPTAPLTMVGSMVIKAGEEITSFMGYNTVMLTEQCGVSVDDCPLVLFPERTSFRVDSIGKIMFDRQTLICLLKSDNEVHERGNSNGIEYIKHTDGTLEQFGHAILGKQLTYTHIAVVTESFPIPFVDKPIALSSLTALPSAGEARNNSLCVTNANNIEIRVTYGAASNVNLKSFWGLTVSWYAIGRWK